MRPALFFRSLACAGVLVVTTLSTRAWATPGTHPSMVSTWDTTASSITGSFTGASFGSGGRMFVGSYASSFSSTSGNIGAQFGVHYINYAESSAAPIAHGGSGTAAFVFSAPLLGRHASGLPKVALGFYVGMAPTLLVSGERNYGWVPLTTGIAAPISPWPFLSIVPSVEAGMGITLDTIVRAPDFTTTAGTVVGPDGSIRFSQADIDRLVADSLRYEIRAAATFRGGLGVAVHLGERIDLGADFGLGNVGTLSEGSLGVFAGAKLQLHWDSVVPAALPARTRLERESCEDVEERFRSCPRSQRPPEAPPPPAPTPSKAPAAPAPAPAPPPSPPPPADAPPAPPSPP